ncbi:AAA family ATPase [Neoroseomonas soli]|uniref:AAA family ATPase n=1 Tax=Neoroseomonas soli TaxID=1081025 RepID=A0A9X9X278_9PROT|nr:AAA family ATPase [Neoroseomonas soli]MBR0673507.1 AAA family ATPase [Neoroseomonas soli]
MPTDDVSGDAPEVNRKLSPNDAPSGGPGADWLVKFGEEMYRKNEENKRALKEREERARDEARAREAFSERDGAIVQWMGDPEKKDALKRVVDTASKLDSSEDQDEAFAEYFAAMQHASATLGVSVGAIADGFLGIQSASGRGARLADMKPAPRQWIVPPWLIRGFITMLAAPGGRGKTSLLYLIALAVLTGEDLLGLEVRRPSSVLMLVQEDDEAEFQRRFLATSRHHKLADGSPITDAAFCGRQLWVRTSPFVIAVPDEGEGDERRHKARRIRVNWAEVNATVAACRLHGVGLVAVDPFSNIHEVEENARADMAPVMDVVVYIAQKADVSVLLVHHTRKGGAGEGGNKADAVRGSSVQTTKPRAVITVETMPEDAAKRLGVPPEERRSYFRADLEGKSNMAPVGEARWFRMIGHTLDNATEEDPADVVGVAERWIPQPLQGLSDTQKAEALRIIAAGPSEGEKWSLWSSSKDRFVVPALATRLGVSDRDVAAALDEWKRAGVVREEWYKRPAPSRTKARGLVVDRDALSGAEQADGRRAPDDDDLPF